MSTVTSPANNVIMNMSFPLPSDDYFRFTENRNRKKYSCDDKGYFHVFNHSLSFPNYTFHLPPNSCSHPALYAAAIWVKVLSVTILENVTEKALEKVRNSFSFPGIPNRSTELILKLFQSE